MFLAPVAGVWAAWRVKNITPIRIALVLNVVAFVVLGAIMSGVANIDLAAFGGLVQKLLAASSFFPGSILAGTALMRSRHQAKTS